MNAADLDALVTARRRALTLRGLVCECMCCGATYALSAWLQLLFVGIQDVGDGEPLELRNCGRSFCRTTLAVPVALSHAWLDDLRGIDAIAAERAERLLSHRESQPVERARELYYYCRGRRDQAAELDAPRELIGKLRAITLASNALLNAAITERAEERQRWRVTPEGQAALEQSRRERFERDQSITAR